MFIIFELFKHIASKYGVFNSVSSIGIEQNCPRVILVSLGDFLWFLGILPWFSYLSILKDELWTPRDSFFFSFIDFYLTSNVRF